jgi:hypothetical protein
METILELLKQGTVKKDRNRLEFVSPRHATKEIVDKLWEEGYTCISCHDEGGLEIIKRSAIVEEDIKNLFK